MRPANALFSLLKFEQRRVKHIARGCFKASKTKFGDRESRGIYLENLGRSERSEGAPV